MLDTESFLLGIAAGGGGGGGNPNYVETISGTLANPWGDLGAAALYLALYRNASASMLVQMGGAAIRLLLTQKGLDEIYASAAYYDPNTSSLNEAVGISWHEGELKYAYVTQNGVTTDMTAYAAAISTTLTVIHHPMP